MKNQDKPLLSILTPLNKPHDFLTRYCDSMLRIVCSVDDVEWIIGLNNVREDLLGDLRKSLTHEKLRIINYGNISLGETRNKLIASSSGKYILFVDSDDALDLSIEYLKEILKENPDSDMLVSSDYYEVSENTGERKVKQYNNKELYKEPLCNFKESKLFQYMWGRIIRRDLAENIQFYNCSMFEDVGAFIDMCKNLKNPYFIKYPIYIRTKSNLNTSGSISESTYRGLEVCVQHWNKDFPDGSMRNKLDNLINYMKSKGNVDEERLKRISESYCQKSEDVDE